jgi:hypothetical protein
LPAVVVYYTNLPSPNAFVYPGAFCGSKTSFSDKPTSAAALSAAGPAVLCGRTGARSIARLSWLIIPRQVSAAAIGTNLTLRAPAGFHAMH